MTDMINHPPHYTNGPARCECGRTIECIDVAENYPFTLGNCIKYIWRAGIKENKQIEDLKKARWYLDREISRLEK